MVLTSYPQEIKQGIDVEIIFNMMFAQSEVKRADEIVNYIIKNEKARLLMQCIL